jgi:Ca2+-binding EF-hand superfamily protein
VCVCIHREKGEVTESLKLVNIMCLCVYKLQEEVTESLKLANIDKDGKIDYKEFAKVLLCCVANVLLICC